MKTSNLIYLGLSSLLFVYCSDSSSGPDSNVETGKSSEVISSSETTVSSSSTTKETSLLKVTVQDIEKRKATLNIPNFGDHKIQVSLDSNFTSPEEKTFIWIGDVFPIDELKPETKYFVRAYEEWPDFKVVSEVASFTTANVEAPVLSIKEKNATDVVFQYPTTGIGAGDYGKVEFSYSNDFSDVFTPGTFATNKTFSTKINEERVQTYPGQTIWVRSKGETGLYSNLDSLTWEKVIYDTNAATFAKEINATSSGNDITITITSSDLFKSLVIIIPNAGEEGTLDKTGNFQLSYTTNDDENYSVTESNLLELTYKKDGEFLDFYFSIFAVESHAFSDPTKPSSGIVRISHPNVRGRVKVISKDL